MAQPGETRIQLCGRLAVTLNGRRVEEALTGAKGQLLFAYLVLNRLRRIDRDELLAVYGQGATPDHQPRLSVVLSKLRRVLGPELLTGRAQIELVLPSRATRRCSDEWPLSLPPRPPSRPGGPRSVRRPLVPCRCVLGVAYARGSSAMLTAAGSEKT
jgi:hypothetical protein